MTELGAKGTPTLGIFTSADSKGFVGGVFVSADSAGVICCILVHFLALLTSADFKRVSVEHLVCRNADQVQL
jgi:hypothetical protein